MHPRWWAARAHPGEPGQLSPSIARAFDRLGGLIRIAHAPTIEGLENLPESGAFLLVANHSGGIAVSEIASFGWLWRSRIGADRKLAGLGHPFGFSLWPISFFVRRLGMVPSTREHALAALARGIPVLVFPGGDYETSRPIWQATRVQFAGRKGFLKLAREAKVPVVPMGIRGSAFTAPNLWRSRLLAWLLVIPKLVGVRQFPLTALGLLGALAAALLPIHPAARALLAWAWVGSLFALLPWIPARIRFRLGKPIPSEELFPSGTEDERQLALAYQRVESEVQALVDGGSAATRP
ncbi:MAG TPA: 1-acyl-sn-glycerol-3-phosphate acyltransferase [Myxococcales bacterium]|jgi:1-acyl-sn-glycerol-3-phosphate acyltransferase